MDSADPDPGAMRRPWLRDLGRAGALPDCLGRPGAVHRRPRRPGDGDLDLGLELALDPRGDAAVRVDGRDPVPLAPFRGYLPRPRPLARAPAGRAPPRQHRRLRPVCSCLGLIGGDRGHRRQDVAARAQGPSLSRRQGHWHACRLGHPRLPDPALDPSDRLRRHRRTVDLPAVHRRNPARSAGGDPVHGAI
jgi:hypothetical protein